MVSLLTNNFISQLNQENFLSESCIYLQVVGTGMDVIGDENEGIPYLALTDGRNYIMAQMTDEVATRIENEADLIFSILTIQDWDIVHTENYHTLLIGSYSMCQHFTHLLGHKIMVRQENAI